MNEAPKYAVFSGTQENPFERFDGLFPDNAAAAGAVEKLEDGGCFCAIVPISADSATYLTADPE